MRAIRDKSRVMVESESFVHHYKIFAFNSLAPKRTIRGVLSRDMTYDLDFESLSGWT